MPGLKWATSEQETWLSAYYEQYYVPCMPTRNYTDFKPVFYEAWFQRWPEWAVLCKKSGLDPSLPLSKEQESELSDAIKVRKDKLLSWMRWKANKARRCREGTKIHPFQALQSVVAQPKNKRKLTDEEVFSKLHYDDMIRSVYDAECEKLGVDRKDKRARMEVRRRVTKKCWEEAAKDDKISHEITEEHIRRNAEQAEANGGEDDVTASTDWQQKSNVIAAMPAMFHDLLRSLNEQTGWSFSLLAGGPDPSKGTKKANVFSVHTGETSLGMNFVQSYPGYKERVMQPFELFVRYVHDGSNAAAKISSTAFDEVPGPSSDASSLSGQPQSSLMGDTTGYDASSDVSMHSVQYPGPDTDGERLPAASRPVTPASTESSFSFRDPGPPHGAFLPAPPSFENPPGYSSFDDSFDPFDAETLERIVQYGLGANDPINNSVVGTTFKPFNTDPPSSPPTSQYYSRQTRRADLQDSALPAPSLPVDPRPSSHNAIHRTQPATADASALTPIHPPTVLNVQVAKPTANVFAPCTTVHTPGIALVQDVSAAGTNATAQPCAGATEPGTDASVLDAVPSSVTPLLNESSRPGTTIRLPSITGTPLPGASCSIAQTGSDASVLTGTVHPPFNSASHNQESEVAPRRSGRSVIPSTRSAVANEIGAQRKPRGK